MNGPTDSLPSITISPPSAPRESETDKVSQTVLFTAPKVGRKSNDDDSSDDHGGLDGPLVSSASPIPTFQPAQSKAANPRINVYQGKYSDGGLAEIQSNLDRDKSHKLHLDLHLIRRRHHHHRHHLPAPPQQQQPEHDEHEQALGFNYNNRDHDKMHKLHLKLHLPRHSSSLSSKRQLPELVGSADGIDAPIVFMTTLPALKYHEHLECITHPRLTQKEYEHRILTRENTSDANIVILCPGYDQIMARFIEIDRELMMKAPGMVPILLSNHYLQGCKMLFQFPRDPHVCFSFVKRYLEVGPERFTKALLKGWMEVHYSTVLNKCIVYVRLYRLARKLGLHGLKDMAYEAILDDDHANTGPYCIELAKFIFQRSSAYDDGPIQEWCFEHIRHNFILLNQDEEWLNLLPHLAVVFQTGWKNLVELPMGVPRE